MSAVAVAVGVGGALLNNVNQRGATDAAERAAARQEEATSRATGLSERIYNENTARLAPWLQSGQRAQQEQDTLMGYGGDNQGAMTALQSSPGYQFRLSQGLKGLTSGLASRGGMGSGKSLVAGNQYNQNFASTEYGNRLAQLANVSSMGQNAATGVGNAGTQFANTQSNLWTNNANAQGAAGIAGANANRDSTLGLARLGVSAYGMSRNQPTYGSTTQNPNYDYLNSSAYRGGSTQPGWGDESLAGG